MCKGKVVERPVAMQFWGRLLYGDGKEALQSCPSAQNLGGYGAPHLAVTLNILLDGLALFGGQTLEIQSYDLTCRGDVTDCGPNFLRPIRMRFVLGEEASSGFLCCRLRSSRDLGQHEFQFQDLADGGSTRRLHRHSSFTDINTLRHELASILLIRQSASD